MTPGNGPSNDWRAMREQQRAQRDQWRAQWRAERLQRHAQRTAWRGQSSGHNHAVAGIVLLIIGVVFLLTNLGFFYVEDVHRFWPVILIVIGAAKALGYSRWGYGGPRLLWGGGLMVVGGMLLAHNFGYIHGNVWQIIWPMWLIFLGISFLFRQTFWHNGIPPGGSLGGPGVNNPLPGSAPSPTSANVLNETTVFGGINRRVESQEFEGGYLSSTFGGIEIDLRKANTKKDEIVIQADAIFGGIELMVPEYWTVTVRGTSIFGGYDDQTHSPAGGPDQKRPHLVIVGSAVFGGVSVKN
jgi:hypothetical protein